MLDTPMLVVGKCYLVAITSVVSLIAVIGKFSSMKLSLFNCLVRLSGFRVFYKSYIFRRSTSVHLHKFPLDSLLSKKWYHLLRIGKRLPKRALVCSQHFLPSDYRSKFVNKTCYSIFSAG